MVKRMKARMVDIVEDAGVGLFNEQLAQKPVKEEENNHDKRDERIGSIRKTDREQE
jgi:hypothetical protein